MNISRTKNILYLALAFGAGFVMMAAVILIAFPK